MTFIRCGLNLRYLHFLLYFTPAFRPSPMSVITINCNKNEQTVIKTCNAPLPALAQPRR